MENWRRTPISMHELIGDTPRLPNVRSVLMTGARQAERIDPDTGLAVALQFVIP